MKSRLDTFLTALGFSLGIAKVILVVIIWIIFLSPFLIVGFTMISRASG
jgi:hypothetical protein